MLVEVQCLPTPVGTVGRPVPSRGRRHRRDRGVRVFATRSVPSAPRSRAGPTWRGPGAPGARGALWPPAPARVVTVIEVRPVGRRRPRSRMAGADREVPAGRMARLVVRRLPAPGRARRRWWWCGQLLVRVARRRALRPAGPERGVARRLCGLGRVLPDAVCGHGTVAVRRVGAGRRGRRRRGGSGRRGSVGSARRPAAAGRQPERPCVRDGAALHRVVRVRHAAPGVGGRAGRCSSRSPSPRSPAWPAPTASWSSWCGAWAPGGRRAAPGRLPHAARRRSSPGCASPPPTPCSAPSSPSTWAAPTWASASTCCRSQGSFRNDQVFVAVVLIAARQRGAVRRRRRPRPARSRRGGVSRDAPIRRTVTRP